MLGMRWQAQNSGAKQTSCRKAATSEFDPERTSSSERTRCRRSVQRVPSPMLMQGTPMTDREKILIALREKPLKVFEIMKRVNIKHQDDCQSLLLKMRDDGAVKFDIHRGHWLAA
ncbi:hypothetical protein OWC48_34545 [Bradyrhizobium sp. Arg816]|nr:hypothetical protein [Bradyrhizobium sp. Arg816]